MTIANFLSSLCLIVHLLPRCAANRNNSINIPNDVLPVERKLNNDSILNQCGNHSWLMESNCNCADSLDGVIYCDPSRDIFIMSQYCMTIDNHSREEVVGRCPYTYVKFNNPNLTNIGHYYKIPSDVHELEYALCDKLNRRGLLCGKCKDGYGYRMYPDFIKCVECPLNLIARNWLLYVLISFGPLTLFLMLVVCLRINAASPPLNALVFISQIITQPPFTRGFINTINESFLSEGAKVFMKLLHSMYGIWNLDFFTAMIPSFCLPLHSVLHIISITYLIALYPLLVLIVLYVCIELHSRGVRVIVWLWKPFYPCYVRFRRHCDIRASVIDAFTTFLLLSYVKILFISFDICAPTHLMNKNGSSIKLVSYFDASVVISPTPAVVLPMVGVSVLLLVFTLLPLVFILLYPYGFCQKCLSYCKVQFQSLHFLMNAFSGHFKDGISGSTNCRFFAAIFLFVRILISVEYATLYFNYLTSVIITCTALAIAIAVVQPYRKQYAHFNRLDPLLIFFLICWLVSYKDIHRAAGTHLSHQRVSIALSFISLILPIILFTILILKNTVLNKLHSIRRQLTCSLDEHSLEQRSHIPYISHAECIKAQSLL